MAVFNTNQNRHLYIADGYVAYNAELTGGTNNKGKIQVKAVGPDKKEFMFFYVNPLGEVIKSDRIPLCNLDYVKAVKASEMVDVLKVTKVSLDSSVNSGAPVAGQDYLLRIVFRQFYGMSDEDLYIKDICVHATSAMSTAKDLFDAFVTAANAAFSREIGATKTSNPYLTFAAAGSGSGGYLTITEKEQPWVRGVGAYERVYFDVIPTTIYTGGDDVIWGKVEDDTPAKADATVGTNAVGNGKKIADLEWFCAGERGDQYRMMGYPSYIPTEYVAEPNIEYNVLELHFAFTDTGVNSYRSEKDITIAVPMGASDHEYDVINDIIGDINTLTGLEIEELEDA